MHADYMPTAEIDPRVTATSYPPDMERVVKLVDAGRVYTCRVDHDPPLCFWRVETDGREPFLSPLCVSGDEQPAFFYALAKIANRTR